MIRKTSGHQNQQQVTPVQSPAKIEVSRYSIHKISHGGDINRASTMLAAVLAIPGYRLKQYVDVNIGDGLAIMEAIDK